MAESIIVYTALAYSGAVTTCLIGVLCYRGFSRQIHPVTYQIVTDHSTYTTKQLLDSNNEFRCLVCTENILDQQEVIECMHCHRYIGHAVCLKPWYERHNTCIYCRR